MATLIALRVERGNIRSAPVGTRSNTTRVKPIVFTAAQPHLVGVVVVLSAFDAAHGPA